MAGKLTVAAVRSLVAKGRPGRFADGGNLYLAVTGPGAAKWTFRFMRDGRAREMGLGSADANGSHGRTLAQARGDAELARKLLREGHDPVERRQAAARARAEADARGQTFGMVVEQYLASHSAGWSGARHAEQWRASVVTYANPTLGDMEIATIGTNDVLRVLQPIWTVKPEMASRVRGRVEAVLSYAAARGWRPSENPARWRGHLANLLPRRSKVAAVEHHAALPWQDIGAFVARLRGQRATTARALEFAILTACRSGEVLGARWSEVDLDGAVWTVPAARMKAGREHRVPLSNAALAVLRGMLPLRPVDGDGYVFPGRKGGASLTPMSMMELLRRMGRGDLTVHGFRSTFRDWAEETTATPHAVSEAALAHAVSNQVEAAYRRGDLFAKRRALMAEWADYCAKAPAAVAPLAERCA
jgi:integrase